MNPFIQTKNIFPTYMIIPKTPKKTVSILPVENEANVSDEIAKSALKLETARKISIGGDATGAVLFDGSADSEIKIIVKNSERATKDSSGRKISETYAQKSDLKDFAKKSEVAEKINYLESILYATKNAVNSFQTELNSAKETISNIENNSADLIEGENVTLADDEDIENLF